MSLPGCAKSDSATPVAKVDSRPHWPLTGEVLSVDAEQKTLRIRHDEIKGLMPAMTMDFAVSAADVALFKAGDRIRATLVQVGEGEFQLERLFRNDKVADDTVAAVSRQLREETNTAGNKAYHGDPGDRLPDFALYDQDGKVVQFSRYRGKKVMVNFIYTRCPVATMCPASTIKMTQTQRLAREAGVPNLELVSITMDPEHDTPAVLHEYAATRLIDTSNFTFLTGPESAIKDLLTQFGVLAVFEGDLIKHTLTTVLVNEDGKVIERADGSAWEPKDFVAKMKQS